MKTMEPNEMYYEITHKKSSSASLAVFSYR